MFFACRAWFDSGMRLVTEFARLRSEELTRKNDWIEGRRTRQRSSDVGGVAVRQASQHVDIQLGSKQLLYVGGVVSRISSERQVRPTSIHVHHARRDGRGRVRASLQRRRRAPFGAILG